EQSMVEGLLRDLPEDALLLEDRGFFGYNAWKRLNSRGVTVLARVPNWLILKPIRRLSDGSCLAKIYPNSYDREKDRNAIVLRVIRYKLDDPQRTGHDEEHVLITNLLDEKQYPAQELIPLYHQRWEHELVFDEQKTHQNPKRASKPAHLRSETPRGVVQEIYALSVAHFVVRAFMFEAAQPLGLDPDRLSCTGCFQILKCRLPECDSRNSQSLFEWYAALLWELQHEQIEPRRNRINPRVIKQKVKRWPKKRPHHRRPPPLTKTFRESIVMTN
ncbi:MAG: transposase, partial [Planctomycetes bacterium]|nr:transposase [Planctomycetota bacterium]